MKADVSADRTIEVPKITYNNLRYSPRLVRTRAGFYDTLKAAAEMSVDEGRIITPPDAGEEHQIYIQKSPGTKKLQDVEELRDYFANNDEGWYAWADTLTGLRFREADLRKPYKIGDKVTVEVIVTDITLYLGQIADPKFTRDNWKDIIGKASQTKGEVVVPYSRGHVIREMHPTFGIFTEIESTTEHKAPFALHGWLRENLDVPQDPISGQYDIAVGRRGYWLHDVGGGCLGVGAFYGRWGAFSGGGFRPVVRVSDGPKIEIASSNVDVEKVRQELYAQVASDLRKLPPPELLEKYRL